jgi:hypothetical protein
LRLRVPNAHVDGLQFFSDAVQFFGQALSTDPRHFSNDVRCGGEPADAFDHGIFNYWRRNCAGCAGFAVPLRRADADVVTIPAVLA